MTTKKEPIRVGPEFEPGKRLAYRERDDGQIVPSILVQPEHVASMVGRSPSSYVRIVKDESGGHVIESEIRMTAPGGPCRAATAAYRSGWDECFGKKPDARAN